MARGEVSGGRISGTDGIAALAARTAVVNILATLCLVMTLLLLQACITAMPHPDVRNYLWDRIDIPLEVQPLWRDVGATLGYHGHGIAALSPDWPPCIAFLVVRLWAAGLAFLAALRRNTAMFFALLALLAIPGEVFGTNDHEIGPAAAIVATSIVVVRACLARRFRLAAAAGIAASLALGLPALADGHVHSPEGTANQVFDESGGGWSNDTDSVERISKAMAAATARQRPAADYVLAQMAYLRQDWPTARGLALRLRPEQFSHGPYTAKRVFALRAFAAGRTVLVPQWIFHILNVAYATAFLAMVTCAGVAWRMHRRSRRIEILTRRLAPLRALQVVA